MATPQKENGYTAIANEIMEALANYRIPGEQMQCLLVILRKTYGYNKKWDMISNSQFVKHTGLKKSSVCRAIKELVEKNLVYKNANNYIPSYCFNKNYDRWKVLAKKLTYEIPGRVSINDIKEKIRERDSNICVLCGYDGRIILDRLPVHHIDFNQTNNTNNNLITLCKSCHAKAHTKKKQEEILNFIKGVSKKVNRGVTKKRPTKDISTKDIFSEESIEYKLSKLLLGLILERNGNFKQPNLQKWADNIRLLINRDKRDPADIRKVINWCQADDFWKSNILSTGKLRKQFDPLLMKMQSEEPAKPKVIWKDVE